MTHAELRAEFPSSTDVRPTACDGDVTEVDALIDPAEGSHAVQVFRCAGCGHRIAVDAVVGIVRNDYPIETFAALTARLRAE